MAPPNATSRKGKAQHGFTLIEILIVVVILGILAAMVVPKYIDAQTDTEQRSVHHNLKSLRSQINLYYFDNSEYPPTLQALVTEGYIHEVPEHWGDQDWQYDSDTGQLTTPMNANW